MPYGRPIAILKCEVPPNLKTLQNIVLERLRIRHEREKVLKQCTELRKEHAMLLNLGTGKANVDARRKYLMETYVPEVRHIGMTTDSLREMFGHGVVYHHGEISAMGTVLFRVLEGDEAFEKIPTEGALHRQLYVKRGIFGKDNKHYVKDDGGRFTRRFAYVEKDWRVFEILLRETELRGKDVPTKLGGDPYSKGPTVKAKYDFSESDGSDRMSKREMAFINQEDGSTIQRALPLGSSSKHLHGNEGFRFGKPDGVRLKIDLARIPLEGDMNTPSSALFNLYCYDAQSDPRGGTIGLQTYNIKFKSGAATRLPGKLVGTAADSKQHTDLSTSKNRELATLKIPLAAVMEIIFHDHGMYNRERDEVRLFVRPDALIAYGPHPGMLPEEFYSK
jgi:hypothetical protein